MKIMHLGDLHIGKSLSDFDLYSDQEYILNQILDIADSNKADAVLISGDVYDKSIPSEAAVKLFDQFICSLAKKKIKTFIISGNHDSEQRLNFGSSLFESNDIYISAKYDGSLYCKSFEDEYGKINIYLMPYVKASVVKKFFPEKEITDYEDAIKAIFDEAAINKDERNVIAAHQFVIAGSKDPDLGGSEGLGVKNVGTIEKIDSKCFDAFDYAALGHIHSAQKIGREEVRYSGSILKYSLSEVNSKKSVPIASINEKGNVSIELIPLKPLRDLRHIKGKMEILLSKENIKNPDDFIYVTLTDDEIINDAMSIFQQTYPNTIKIDYDNRHSKEFDVVDIKDITKGKSFDETISDFYSQMYGCDISEEELEIMKLVAKEAGI